jgi:hypothetical protein
MALTFFCRFGRGDADLRARLRDTGPTYGSKTMRVTGCSSQIVGMWSSSFAGRELARGVTHVEVQRSLDRDRDRWVIEIVGHVRHVGAKEALNLNTEAP